MMIRAGDCPSMNDKLNSTETDINEGSDAPQSMSPLRKSSISQGQKFEHLFQESRPIPTTRQEYRAPVGPMFANLCCQLPSPQVPTEAQKSLFLDQDEPKPNINKSRRDSGVDMLQDGEGGDVGPEEECRRPIAKDMKRKQSASQSPGMETSKRTKGVAYPVNDGESISKRQRQRRKFCMSSAEAEEFRARQAEYLHDDNAKIISEIPRFTRSQKKVLPRNISPKSMIPAMLCLRVIVLPIQSPEINVQAKAIAQSRSRKLSKQVNRVRQYQKPKIHSEKREEVIESPQSEVETGTLKAQAGFLKCKTWVKALNLLSEMIWGVSTGQDFVTTHAGLCVPTP
ncbi:hypothetical protein DL95DRAFT_508107 [Leptodontidium sp. 2 PMI_412]|nr:hypothetical protein DL95DRAFT_508107 [Leptodontidium sp. 2 PMI_412]